MGVLPLAVLLAVRRRQKIDFELGFYVDGNDSSEAVEFTEDRQQVWMLQDGKEVRELSPSDAAEKVQELCLSGLFLSFHCPCTTAMTIVVHWSFVD